MRTSISGVCGALVGMNFFLALAVIVVIAANGTNNPGAGKVGPSAAAGSTASALAPLPDGSFQGLDLDGDGKISLAEAAGHSEIVVRFERADRDRDGRLTKSEFARLQKLPPPKPNKGPPIRRSDATAASGDGA